MNKKHPLKLIILDRDGVVNQDSEHFVKSPSEWQAVPGSLGAIAKLNRANYLVVIATNQSGIARGLFLPSDLENIHKKMTAELARHHGKLAGIFICPHGPEDNCSCRKPKPGLLLEIMKQFHCAPEEVLSIGDSMRDILAAQACGIRAVLVKTGKGTKTIELATGQPNFPIFNDLASAVEALLTNKL